MHKSMVCLREIYLQILASDNAPWCSVRALMGDVLSGQEHLGTEYWISDIHWKGLFQQLMPNEHGSLNRHAFCEGLCEVNGPISMILKALNILPRVSRYRKNSITSQKKTQLIQHFKATYRSCSKTLHLRWYLSKLTWCLLDIFRFLR